MLIVNDSIPDCHNGADEEDFFQERRHMDLGFCSNVSIHDIEPSIVCTFNTYMV